MIPIWYPKLFEEFKTTLNQYKHLYIALSAGIDSNMLLHWLAYYKAELPPIIAIHVNHNWHNEYSYIWADFAVNSANNYGFECIRYDINIEINDKGAEASGREARYLKFAETMVENSVLLTAHHLSDQAETILYRLIRGSGLQGLGGIRKETTLTFNAQSIKVIRPLLSISKKTLYEAGKALNIPWMEDYSNQDIDVARNQIRNAVLTEVERFFPYYENSFARSAEICQESDTLLEEIASSDYESVIYNEQLIYSKIIQLSELRQKNLLRFWLKRHTINLEKRQFDEFYSMFFISKPNSNSAFTIDHYSIRYFKDHLYLLKNRTFTKPSFDFVKHKNMPPLSFWENRELLLIPRKNGIHFHPIWRNHSTSLKKILQEIELLPWLRDDIQMLIDKNSEEIIWIEHVGLNHLYKNECIENGLMPVVNWTNDI